MQTWQTDFPLSNSCDWSNITLDLDLEDVDTSQFHKTVTDTELFQSTRLQLKTEEFFPNPFDHILERPLPQFEFSNTVHNESTSHPIHISQPSAKPCPCCKEEIDLTLSNFHAHVSQCFLDYSNDQPEASESKRIADSIQNIRKCVSQLDLRERISLMESLARLANAATSTANKCSTLSSRAMESDHFVISLLYGNPTEQRTELAKKSPTSLKIEAQNMFKSPFYPESTTPTISPSSPVLKIHASPMKIGSFPPAPVLTGRLFNKRKNRDIVQALSFDQLAPHSKMARV